MCSAAYRFVGYDVYVHPNQRGHTVPSFFFTTSLSGAALDNIPAGTTILGTLTANTFNPIPTTDVGGFPVGIVSPTSGVFEIGTDATGQITSWHIFENFSALYPGDNVSCEYSASTTPGGDLLQLTGASDGFVCRDGAESPAGTFTAEADAATTPLPAALPLFSSGASLLGF